MDGHAVGREGEPCAYPRHRARYRFPGGLLPPWSCCFSVWVGLSTRRVCPCWRHQGPSGASYHKDRFGRRSFCHFAIPREFHAKFDASEGKHIEVEVLEGVQERNPGGVTIRRLGKIAEVPGPNLAVTVSTVPGKFGPGTPFQLLLQAKNTGDTMVTKEGWGVVIDGEKIPPSDRYNGVWGWATSRGPYQPDEHYFDLKNVRLPTGDHEVQAFMMGSGDKWYTNANGKQIPAFQGTLHSNTTKFTIIAANG